MFNNGHWIYWIAKIAQAIADDTAKGIEISKADRQQLAQEYKDAKASGTFVCLTSKAYSKKSLEKDIQSVVDTILFIPKENEPEKNSLVVTSKDVNFLLARRSKAGKEALSIRCMNQPRSSHRGRKHHVPPHHWEPLHHRHESQEVSVHLRRGCTPLLLMQPKPVPSPVERLQRGKKKLT